MYFVFDYSLFEMIEYTKILECIKESIRTISNMNGVSYNEIKKLIQANGSKDIEVILAVIEEGTFMNVFGIDSGFTKKSYPLVKDKLAKDIKSRSNVRRWMRIGPIQPICF